MAGLIARRKLGEIRSPFMLGHRKFIAQGEGGGTCKEKQECFPPVVKDLRDQYVILCRKGWGKLVKKKRGGAGQGLLVI